MELPAQVVHHLQDEFLLQTRPFCFLVDKEYRLVENWGDGSWCGLTGIKPAVDMRGPAPFLTGVPLTEVMELEFVETPSQAIVNMHVIPSNGQCYIVLLDASQVRASIQSRQQSVNELRLMHASQQKLIARQRELIGQLVETRSELDHHRRVAQRAPRVHYQSVACTDHRERRRSGLPGRYHRVRREAAADS